MAANAWIIDVPTLITLCSLCTHTLSYPMTSIIQGFSHWLFTALFMTSPLTVYGYVKIMCFAGVSKKLEDLFNIGGSGGAAGTCPRPRTGSNSFVFAYVFTEKCLCWRLAPPQWLGVPQREILDLPLIGIGGKLLLLQCLWNFDFFTCYPKIKNPDRGGTFSLIYWCKCWYLHFH